MNNYILVTGASRGIGRAIALEFAGHGHNMVIVSKSNFDDLKTVQTLINEMNVDCVARQCDVSDFSNVQELKEYLKQCDIHINCIVNNAGISHFGLLQDMSVEEWNNIINTNLSSVFYTSKCFINDMLHDKSGSIINISSVWGVCGASCEVAYSATKGGINAFTKALAKELAPSHISVNAIACGAIETSMNHRLSDEEKITLEEEIPFGRMGTPEEVARLAYNIFTSPDYMTGQIITFDGGWI